MDLTVLGANGTYPTKGGACSGYLVRHDGYALWMDAGNGTLARLQEHVAIREVDSVFLSHAHPDHCADIYPFFYAILLDPKRVPVYAPPGVLDRLITLIGEDSRDAFTTLLDWRVLAPGDVLEAGPFTLEAFESVHTTENATVRARADGRVLCFSGDTGPNPHLARAAREADLFLCEASWLDSDAAAAPIHLRAREAGEAAREAGAARLVLTHVWPRNDLSRTRAEAGEAYGADVELALELGTAPV